VSFGLRRTNAAAIYLTNAAAGALISSLIFTPLAVYYVTTVGLDPLQLVLVGTVLEGTIILFEIPTGVVADVYSRRLSIVLGRLLFGVAFLLEGSLPVFGAILLAEVIRGIGETFLSGASQAWLADEVGEAHLGPIFVRAAQLRRAAGLLGIAAGVGLASVRLNLAVLVGGFLSIGLAVLLALSMPETGFRPSTRPTRAPIPAMRHVIRASVGSMRRNPLLLAFVGIAAAAGASSEGFDRLWEAHLLGSFTFPAIGSLQPVVWFGILNAVGALLGIAAIQSVARLKNARDADLARVLLVLQSGWIICVLIFGLTSSFVVAALALWCKRIVESTSEPLFNTWQTRVIPSEIRATVLSALGQGDALGQVLVGPLIGAIGTAASLRAAMLASSILHTPVLALLLRARNAGASAALSESSPTQSIPPQAG
jgi:DHA3 family tetracycline resistance protein-like MFS transporter